MNKISFFNVKGGTGKTTSLVNLAGALAKFFEKKVLVIDLDPEAHATADISHDQEAEVELAQIIIDFAQEGIEQNPNIAIVKTDFDNIDLMPASDLMNDATEALFKVYTDNKENRNNIMRTLFSDFNEELYDFILIDCQGSSINPLNDNALTYSDYVMIPMETDYKSGNGLKSVINKIKDIKENDNEYLDILGIFFNRTENRRTQDKSFLEGGFSMYKNLYIDLPIKNLAIVRDAANYGKPLAYFKPKEEVTKQYKKLAKEIIKRVGE